jgi:hypothetical protein
MPFVLSSTAISTIPLLLSVDGDGVQSTPPFMERPAIGEVSLSLDSPNPFQGSQLLFQLFLGHWLILTVQRDHSKTGFFVYLLSTVALHDIDQFKVFQAGSIGLRVADNVESIIVLTEVNGEAIRLVCSSVSPISGSDSGLGFGEGLWKIQHRMLQFFG